jgi:hypothetical protein
MVEGWVRKLERQWRLALRGVGPTGWRPNPELFKTAVDVFSIHDWFIS